MIPTEDLSRVRRVLDTDRAWSAYALADLDPAEAPHSRWFVADDAVALLYHGLQPPILFAHGGLEGLSRLAHQLPAGRCVYTLLPEARSRFAARLVPQGEVRMWRMVLEPESFRRPLLQDAVRLAPKDLPHLRRLFARHPDQPDAFHPRQLDSGVFYGVCGADGLLSVAGTHVLSRAEGIAAIGNVFTSPEARGRGLAAAVTGAVIETLLQEGIDLIVLNVAEDNEPAIRCYRRLGFRMHCVYWEGVGRLTGQTAAPRRSA